MSDSILLYSSYYFVRCQVSYDGVTAISPTSRFRTEAQEVSIPVIISPAEGDTLFGTDIEVCWQEQAASGFRIELSTVETFATRKTKIANQDYDKYCYTYEDKEPSVYYVRVRALADGAWTEPSEAVSFVLELPDALRQTESPAATDKVIRNGQLLIRHNGEWYDLLGNKQ